jgi:mannose-1-phosphate guanylyltransferase
MNQVKKHENIWAIILAGGDGERLRSLTEQWLGYHKPKQYCAFIGTRSMLQHTLDRADALTTTERRVTVIRRSHLWDVSSQLSGERMGKLLLQPANRDTAAGVFLGLAYVRAYDPQGTVVLYPSDHFVHPEERFTAVVSSAIIAAERLRRWLFVLGVSPDKTESEYGWIQPGAQLGRMNGHSVRAVQAFVEKPGLDWCRRAMSTGALWNTLVLAASVETLWSMGRSCFPEMMPLFERYQEAVGTLKEEIVIDEIFEQMPARNFSTDLLQRVVRQVAVIEMKEVLWSDWGRRDRIVETLNQIGKSPNFPIPCGAVG